MANENKFLYLIRAFDSIFYSSIYLLAKVSKNQVLNRKLSTNITESKDSLEQDKAKL